MASSTAQDTQVLIIGAGVVGLSASLFLAQHGVKSIIIERRPGTSVHPRARSVNIRTVELFRRLGIEKAVHEAGKGIASSKGIFTGTSLKEVIEPRSRRRGQTIPFSGIAEQISPVKGTFVTQDKLEPVLVNTARERGIDIRFNHDFQSLTQDAKTVTTIVKDRSTGTTKSISASYVIAADGAKSPVCSQLGVTKSGRGTMGHMINILFRAQLEDFVKDREFSLLKVITPQVSGLFTSINNSDRWVFHLSYDPSKGEQASDYSAQRCAELVKLALGIPDLDITIESLLPWEPAVNVADQMQHGRIFLAGDAAHQMPPYAGQGANSGFADVHNLAWKLAAVLDGKADQALLSTYDIERQPVGAYAAEASATGADKMGNADMNLWRREVRQGLLMKLPLFTGLGYGYRSPSICEESTCPLGGLTWIPWSLSALFLSLDGRPGRRVPHIWVNHNGERISTIDVIGNSFVIFADENLSARWKTAASNVSKELQVPIDVRTVGLTGDLVARAKEWNTATGITSEGALLVRPDDFVVKRWRRGPLNITTELRQAVKQVLCHQA